MNLYLGLPLFEAFFSLVLLIIVLRAKSQDASRRVFAMYLGGLLAWGVLIFLMRSSPSLGTAHIWEKMLLPLGLLLSVILYHFSVTFGGFRINRWIIPASYASCVLFLFLSEFGLVVKGMQMLPYGYAPIPGPLFMVVALSGYVLVVAAIINLWKYSRTTLSKGERNRSLYIIVGLIISIIGGAFDVLPLLGFDLYPGLIVGNIIFCIIASIAILKYRLLGIHVIMRKGITYFLTSSLIVIPYLIVFFIFERVLRVSVPTWSLFILLLFLAFILQPAWRFVQSLVDKVFFLSRYDFLKALDEFSLKNHRINNIKTFGGSLVKLVERALQSTNVYLFLPSDKGAFNLVSAAKETVPAVSVFSHNPVLSWLRSHKVLLRREDLAYVSRLQTLTTAELNEIKTLNAELFVPVLGKEGELVGLMVLGPKLNRKHYSDEDEQLILTVTRRLALELENARLYSLEIAARQELQKQNDMKTEFLNSAAHELKTPLTAIISSSEILAEKLSRSDDVFGRELSNNICKSALVMDRRVSELLDFARVQIGSLKMDKQSLDVNRVIQDVASQLSPLFANRKQHLGLEVQPVAAVRADKDKLEQVFTNLLSNANKYSPNNSEIIVRTRQDNGSVVIEVEDSAPIISENERSKLFVPYYRGEDAKERQRIPGLGLGLAISKKIVEMHGGKIWVDCNPGKGNIFSFSLATSS